MSIEYQRDGHPDNNKQNGNVAKAWGLEQVQHGVAIVSGFFLLQADTAFGEILIHFGVNGLPVDLLELFQDVDSFVHFALGDEPSAIRRIVIIILG